MPQMMYLTMKEKVETALDRGYVSNDLLSSGEDDELFERWKGFTRHDHPSVIQVFFYYRQTKLRFVAISSK